MREVLAAIELRYQHRCVYMTSDGLQKITRQHVEHLSAIRIRPTGACTSFTASTRQTWEHCGIWSAVPDQDEMREMVIKVFTTSATDELDRLAEDIAAAQRARRFDEAAKLYERFTAYRERPPSTRPC